jgi:hypothetical protein
VANGEISMAKLKAEIMTKEKCGANGNQCNISAGVASANVVM